MKLLPHRSLWFLLLLTPLPVAAQNLLVNGSFEQAPTDGSTLGLLQNYPQSVIAGWDTTGASGFIEIHRGSTPTVPIFTYTATGTPGSAWDAGDYYAETVANNAGSALYQTVTAPSAGLADYYFLHHGRVGADTVRLRIVYLGANGTYGNGDDVVMVSRTITTDNVQSTGEVNGWQLVTGNDVFTTIAGGNYRFEFTTVSTSSGDLTAGNFVDNAAFGIGLSPLGVPEPGSATLAALATGLVLLRGKRR